MFIFHFCVYLKVVEFCMWRYNDFGPKQIMACPWDLGFRYWVLHQKEEGKQFLISRLRNAGDLCDYKRWDSFNQMEKHALEFEEETKRKKQPPWMVFSFNYYGKFRVK